MAVGAAGEAEEEAAEEDPLMRLIDRVGEGDEGEVDEDEDGEAAADADDAAQAKVRRWVYVAAAIACVRAAAAIGCIHGAAAIAWEAHVELAPS